MGCVQSYFKRVAAHNAGISPSSTQESNSKQAASEDGTRPVQEERSITEEPESNDTSYGVEATAVRTLAATTGTVAILGTTAKTGDKKDETSDKESNDTSTPVVVETIPEEQEEPIANVEKAVVHEEEKVEVHEEESKLSENSSKPTSENSRPETNQTAESGEKKEDSRVEHNTSSPPSTLSEVKEERVPNESPLIQSTSPLTSSNKSGINSPELKAPILPPEETEQSHTEENSSELIVSEVTKEKEEDLSKSISSERLKTNSISNTTLSSDSIAEFESNSVKQSPSADKVIESFDSSSTVEFVDVATKDSLKGEGHLEDSRTNPARSISSDLSNKANLPVDGEKTPDVISPVEPEEHTITNNLPSLETNKNAEAAVLNDQTEIPSNLENVEEVKVNNALVQDSFQTEKDGINLNSSLKDQVVFNDEGSLNSEASSNMTSSVQSSVKNDANTQEFNSKSAIENSSEDNNKAETGSPFSSDNNSSLNDNGDGTSPVTAVVISPAPSSSELKVDSNKESVTVENYKEEVNFDHIVELEQGNHEKEVKSGNHKSQVNLENHKEEVKFENEEKIAVMENEFSAASEKVKTKPGITNGPSTRTETPDDKPLEESPSIETVSKTNFAEEIYGLESKASKSNENGMISDDVFGSPIDVVDEKIIAAATTIQASFRGFQTRQNIKANEKDVVEEQQSTAETVESDIKKSNGAFEETPLNSVSEAFDSTTEQPDSILEDVDDKLVAAATTIQATFRGFQTRQSMKTNLDSGLPPSDETNISSERKTPTALTPELIESVKEEVNDICKEAETIVAERCESAEGMIMGVDQVVVEMKESALPSVSESVQAVRGSTTPHSVSDAGAEETLDAYDTKEEVFDSLPEVDEKTINAATTIQATFRGFQTRKGLQQNQEQPDVQGGTDTTSTSTNVLDSDQSLSVSREDDGVRSAISTEEESEICRHLASPEGDTLKEVEVPRPSRSVTKRMSLGGGMRELPPVRERAPLRSSMSVQIPGPEINEEEVWDTLKNEMSDAATRIQSNFRGYRARKQLQREDAMQVTSSSSQATPSSGSVEVGGRGSGDSGETGKEEKSTRSSGEYHDMIALTPPDLQKEGGGAHAPATAVSDQTADDTDMVKRRAEDDAKEAAAATKIQATYRGFKSRQELKDVDQAAAKIQAGFRGYKVRKELKKNDRVRRSSNPEEGDKRDRLQHTGSVEESAATKIQAGVRGFLVRRKYQKEQEAATKIQAGFRGFHSRKQVHADQ